MFHWLRLLPVCIYAEQEHRKFSTRDGEYGILDNSAGGGVLLLDGDISSANVEILQFYPAISPKKPPTPLHRWFSHGSLHTKSTRVLDEANRYSSVGKFPTPGYRNEKSTPKSTRWWLTCIAVWSIHGA